MQSLKNIADIYVHTATKSNIISKCFLQQMFMLLIQLASEIYKTIPAGMYMFNKIQIYIAMLTILQIKGTPWDETFSMLSILKMLLIWSLIAYWS